MALVPGASRVLRARVAHWVQPASEERLVFKVSQDLRVLGVSLAIAALLGLKALLVV